MNNFDKSKKQLLGEIELLSTKIGRLEKSGIDHKLAENALNVSEEKFRILYETSRDAIMMLAPPNWLFTAGNQASIKMFHAKNEKEFISKEPWELSPQYQPDGQLSSDKAKKMIQKAMKTGSNFFEWTHNRINGEDFPATVLLTRIKLKDKQLLQATVRDITKRKRIEEELNKHRHQLEELVNERTKEIKKEKEYYHSFVTSLNDWVWEMDIDGVHTYSNPAVESILGYKVEDVIGRHVSELWLDITKTPKHLKLLKNSLASGKGWKNFSGRFQHKNGSLVYTESAAIPIYNSKNKLVGYRGLDHDITERKKAEEKLKASEKRFRSIFSNISNIAVQGYDKDRKVTFWNKASEKLYGYSQKEAINKKLEDLIIPPEMREDVISMINNWYEKNIHIPNGELILMKKDNSLVHVFSSHVMIEKTKGEKEMFCIDIDITDRKIAEEEITLGRERLTMLNKIIRHDLSNDFMVIQSAINIFKKTPDPKMIEEIESRVDKSLKTIDNYRKYEAFINSNADLDEIEIAEKIKNIITDFPKIKFSVEGECQVFADEGLYPVFANLISNSIKHGKASQIDIIISSKENLCEIRFMDNGVGIPDEIKFMIFNEGFYHGKSGHTGIGLHIVKKTIERYGGHIYVEDNKPKGVAFIIGLRKVLNIPKI
ncbi:MAG: PAS domain-containing sensor histidine kinase [Candidatus Cloacimonadota bacterium]|nr:PAS domain-containing sensor histidine kinase [Candidatus Cloacimonadota bacterium]